MSKIIKEKLKNKKYISNNKLIYNQLNENDKYNNCKSIYDINKINEKKMNLI